MGTETMRRAADTRRRYPMIPARAALAQARHAEARPAWADELAADGGPVEVDGFDLTMSTEVDVWADVSHLGTFSDAPDPDAIRNPEARGGFSHAYRYFLPEVTEAEHREGLRRMGYSRGVAGEMARRFVLEEMAAARYPEVFVLVVTARRAGVELGSAALGGVELGGDLADERDYLATLADELGQEAIEEARASMVRLCAEAGVTA